MRGEGGYGGVGAEYFAVEEGEAGGAAVGEGLEAGEEGAGGCPRLEAAGRGGADWARGRRRQRGRLSSRQEIDTIETAIVGYKARVAGFDFQPKIQAGPGLNIA